MIKSLWNMQSFLVISMARGEFLSLFQYVYANLLKNRNSRAELAKVKSSGRIPILDVDLRGVQSLKNIQFDAKYLFITAPTFDSLVWKFFLNRLEQI